MESYIKKIQIKKVRHLENLTINTGDSGFKHIIITGKNGSGKTSLLEMIRSFLQLFPDGEYLKYVSEWERYLIDWKKEYAKLADRLEKTMEQQAKMQRAKEMKDFFAGRLKKYAGGVKIEFDEQNAILEKYEKGEFILAYFSATRNVKIEIPTNVPKIELQEKYNMEENIGRLFLNYLVYLKTQQSFARNENDMAEVNMISEWFDRFEQALRTLFEDESITLKFDYKKLNFKICQNNREDYGFDALSDGYSAVLDIVINLILRMEKHHKQAYDMEGIVVIDELENHLHIGLQKKILPFLTAFFPKIQFIISTHSPFIISSIENAVIYDLENRKQVTDLSGYGYEGIVEGYFNVNQYSEKVMNKLERYQKLVETQEKREQEREEELELRGYLKNISSELAPDVALAFNRIELERKNKLKMQG